MSAAYVSIYLTHLNDAPLVWTRGTTVAVEVAGVTIFVNGGAEHARALAAALTEAADMAERTDLPVAA